MIIFIVVLGASFYYFKYLLDKPANNSAVEFIIKDSQSTGEIINGLENKGLISSRLAFTFWVRTKQPDFKAGDYIMPANIKASDLVNILVQKSHQVNWITIKDGWRREQVAAYLSKNLGLSADDFLLKTAKLEGQLYPDTYKLSDQPTIDEAIGKITSNYQNKIDGQNITADDLILASIIQKEAGPVEDMPEIAAIFKNRIKIGMKLQSDVTAIYQKDSGNWRSEGLTNYKFWQPESGVTQNYPGPYNTYSTVGLPPAPICSPSVDAINAVLNPANNNYLFFLYGEDGKIRYANTQAQQDANALKYM